MSPVSDGDMAPTDEDVIKARYMAVFGREPIGAITLMKFGAHTVAVVIDDLQDFIGQLYSDADERRIFAKPWTEMDWDEEQDNTGAFRRSEAFRTAVEDAMLQLGYAIDSTTQVDEMQHHWDICKTWHRLAWRQYMYTKFYSGLVGIVGLH